MKKIMILFSYILPAFLTAQTVGIGSSSFTPASMLSVKGNLSVGDGYETTAAPTNGLIVKGNVGIGTTSPGDVIHLKNDANSIGGGIIENADGGSAAGIQLQIRNSTALGDALRLITCGSGYTTTGGFVQDGAAISAESNLSGGLSLITRGNANIRFYTNGHTNERMRIDGTGNMGIGTTSPGERLDVSGAIRIGTTSNTVAGNIRWTGSDFEGYTGSAWKSLTGQASYQYYEDVNTNGTASSTVDVVNYTGSGVLYTVVGSTTGGAASVTITIDGVTFASSVSIATALNTDHEVRSTGNSFDSSTNIGIGMLNIQFKNSLRVQLIRGGGVGTATCRVKYGK